MSLLYLFMENYIRKKFFKKLQIKLQNWGKISCQECVCVDLSEQGVALAVGVLGLLESLVQLHLQLPVGLTTFLPTTTNHNRLVNTMTHKRSNLQVSNCGPAMLILHNPEFSVTSGSWLSYNHTFNTIYTRQVVSRNNNLTCRHIDHMSVKTIFTQRGQQQQAESLPPRRWSKTLPPSLCPPSPPSFALGGAADSYWSAPAAAPCKWPAAVSAPAPPSGRQTTSADSF